ncbi:MAG TPA: class I SAM-dependent methyltransferase [Candidatus Solibacter sp.]|nr:class I SAM-dependent methyltransferase [Candidatus Solibacter sp.]
MTAPDDFPPRIERDTWQRPVEIMERLGIRAGNAVADVGAGDGYFTFRLAARVGAGGKVFAQDLDETALKKIADRAQQEKIGQIETIQGTADDPKLRESSLDAIVVFDAFHGFTHPDALLAGFYRALRPGGHVAVLERSSPGFPPEMLISHAAAAGLRLVSFDADFSGPKSDRSYMALLERPR